MKKRKWFKYLNVLLLFMLLVTFIPNKNITLAEEQAKSSDANTMTRSLITFFRDDRTKLQVERVSRDELMVYGVFLSNFFIPWSTKLGDMVKDEGDKSIPKQISTKFFGSTDKSSDIAELNKKLYDAINGGLGFDKKTFTMFKDKSAKTPLTGQLFYEKMAGKDSDPKIYGSNGQVLLDLSDKGTQASIQVLFGFEPEFMISKDKGLRKLNGMYMDGLGNIWGSYGKVDVNDYVLFMPSALNPVVFSKKTSDTKFPVSNVFAMGGVLKITQNFLDGKKKTTPYYNIKDYIPTSSSGPSLYNKGNIVTIFGVQSPTSYVGNSDKIIKDFDGGNPMKRVKDFLSQDSTSTLSGSELNIVLSVDTTKLKDLDDHIVKGNDLSQKQRLNLINYLFKTKVFKADELADYMYYFKVPNAESQNASGNEEGSFGEVTDLIRKQKLFAKEVGNEGSDEYGFYSKSYLSSPFNSFLSGYLEAKDKNKYLKDRLPNGKKLKSGDKHFEALKKFLETGSFGTDDVDTINDALTLFKGDNELVYNIVEPSTETANIVRDKWLFEWIYSSSEPTSFGLTKNDRYLTIMSVAAKYTNLFKELTTKYDVETKAPFKAGKGGGSINKGDKKSVEKIATYFHTFYTYRIFSMNSTFTSQLTGVAAGAGKFPTYWGDKKLVNKTAIMNGVNNYPGMYWGYMVDLLSITVKSDGSGFNDPESYNNPHLPYMEISTLGGPLDLNEVLGASGVVASEEKTLEEMQKDIIKKVYGLLSDGPNDYRDKLIKSAQDSWVLATHRAITGSWVGNILSVSAGGNASYASVVGYINTPSLTELPLTDWILSDYVYIYILLMMLVIMVLVLMVITNVRTVREGLLIFAVMAFVLVLPQFLVGNVINLSNAIGDKIYSGRFNYWAITQHQQSITNLKGARVTGDEIDYIIATNMEMAKNVYSSDVGVRVKWMSPKKDDIFDKLFNKNSSSQSLTANLTLFRWLFNSFFNQEEYVYNDPLATYLYRPYNAIAMDASSSYEALSKTVVKRQDMVNKVTPYMKKALGLPDYRFALLKNPEGKIKYPDSQKKLIDAVGPYKVGKDKEKIENYRYWVLNNPEVSKAIFNNNYNSPVSLNGETSDPYYNAFSLATESPFYYFYNVFKHRYSDAGTGASFKSALLSKDLFKVTSADPRVNNKLRDFLDLEGLFTYVIPYLNQGNEYVYNWTSIHGKGVDAYDFDSGVAPDKSKNPELYARYMEQKTKKENLKKVWKLYSPWVDQLYSLGVMNQKAYVGDKKVYIADALNPGAYQAVGRPMIFSEADMYAKRYRKADLSDVELRIQATLESTYRDLMYLTNYYDFDDEVLITAAAMMATFNFNREFSDYNLISPSAELYPQNFELKNFNYDAFMRLMLLNSTGEPLMAEKDLYARVLEKTSIFTGLLLIVCDLMAVVLIPTAKLVVLLLLLFLSIAVSIACVLTPPEKLFKTVMKNVGYPSLLFLVASSGFAFVISLCMGEGLAGYVGSRTPNLGVSDPTIVMGVMVIVDSVYLFILWKVIKGLIDSLKSNLSKSIFSTISLLAGTGAKIIGGGLNVLKKVTFGTVSGVAKGVFFGVNTVKRYNERKKFNSLFNDEDNDYNSAYSAPKINEPFRAKADDVDGRNGTTMKDESFSRYIDELASSRKESRVSSKANVDEKLTYIAKNQYEIKRKLEKLVKLQSKNLKRSKKHLKVVKKSQKSIKTKLKDLDKDKN